MDFVDIIEYESDWFGFVYIVVIFGEGCVYFGSGVVFVIGGDFDNYFDISWIEVFILDVFICVCIVVGCFVNGVLDVVFGYGLVFGICYG